MNLLQCGFYPPNYLSLTIQQFASDLIGSLDIMRKNCNNIIAVVTCKTVGRKTVFMSVQLIM